MTFVAGMAVAVPVFALGLIFDTRIVFISACVVFLILSSMYPMSRFSGQLDENDPALKKNKKKEEAAPVPVSYSPEQIIIGEDQTDSLIDPNPEGTTIDVASFIDDLADETNTEGGMNNGYLE